MNEQIVSQQTTEEIIQLDEKEMPSNPKPSTLSIPSVSCRRYKARGILLTVQMFDILIRFLGEIPTPRSSMSTSQFQQQSILIYGGSNEKDDLDDCYILDLGMLFSADRFSKMFSSLPKSNLIGKRLLSIH